MEAHEYDTLAAFEDRHWWFRAMRKIVLDRVTECAKAFPGGRRPVVLEVGCGTGGLLPHLPEHWDRRGVELEARAVQHCVEARGLDVIQGDVTALPLASASVDLVLALDVIEHVADDVAALREIRRVLGPTGAVVLTVPSGHRLWSEHDEALHHYRRYRTDELRERLAESGLRPDYLSPYNTWLFAPVAAARFLGNVRRSLRPRTSATPASDVSLPPVWLNGLLERAFASERAWLRRGRFPVGVSLLAVAHPAGPR